MEGTLKLNLQVIYVCQSQLIIFFYFILFCNVFMLHV